MFCDLVGSTPLAAKLDPEDLHEVLRRYQDACAGVIIRFEGYVAKFLGDGILAYFGYPQAHEDDAERAIRAGLAIIDAVGRLTAPDGTQLSARVGIARGLVVVGDLIGQESAQERAVAGETPNLAARLQALAEPGSVVISASVQHLAGAVFEYADLGEQRLKGFDQPVRVMRVLRLAPAVSRFEMRHLAGQTPLVGRDEELALLLEQWASANAGGGQVVLLSGEPGIGKSRLVQALLDRLTGEPLELIRFQCSSYFANTPLYSVIAWLERAAGLHRDESPETKLTKLEALLNDETGTTNWVTPLFADLLSLPLNGRYPPLAPTPQQRREALLEALVEDIARRAAKCPMLVDFEDAHWIDPTSLDFLNRLVERTSNERILLLITSRPEFTPPWSDNGHITTLVLDRLNQHQGRIVASHVAAGAQLPTEVLAQILERTDGIPLFVEELTKAVIETGLLRDEGGRYGLTRSLRPLTVPATLHDSLTARLDRLGPAKEVAQIAAVIGREFTYSLLAVITPLPSEQLQAALGQLVDAELVLELGKVAHLGYSFKHALVQDAAYASLLRAKRRQLHATIAAALEHHFPTTAEAEPELVAHHYSAAELPEQAIGYWDKAARRAIVRSGSIEAVGHLRRALALLGGLPASSMRSKWEVKLQTALGAQLAVTKGYAAPDVEEAFRRARRLCQELGDAPELPPVLFGLWRYYLARARYTESQEMAEHCLALAERAQDTSLILEAYHALSWTSMALGQLERAREQVEVTLRLYEPEAHSGLAFIYGTDPGPHSRALLSWQLWLLGWPDQALAASERSLAEAAGQGHRVTLGICQVYAAVLHELRREPQRVAEVAAEAIATCREQGVGFYLALSTIMYGWALAQQGNLGSISTAKEGLDAFLKTGALVLTSYFRATLADVYRAGGRPDEALQMIDEALLAIEGSHERCFEADLHRCRGELLLMIDGGNEAEAEACFWRAVDLARHLRARSLELRAATSLARLRRNQGKRTEAYHLLAPIYGWFTQGFDTRDLKEAAALLDELG